MQVEERVYKRLNDKFDMTDWKSMQEFLDIVELYVMYVKVNYGIK
jgi:hypothetical protein